jgi:hypothetical protein
MYTGTILIQGPINRYAVSGPYPFIIYSVISVDGTTTSVVVLILDNTLEVRILFLRVEKIS